MDNPVSEVMEVLVRVAFPELEAHTSEEAWEQDIVNAVGAAVCADKTIEVQAVKSLEYDDCTWMFEGGMPMPKYGVTVGQDGSWHSGIIRFPDAPEARGEDLQSLFDYLVAKGLEER